MYFLPEIWNASILVFWEKDRKCSKPICRHRFFNILFLFWISQIMEVMAQKQHKKGNRSFVRCSFPSSPIGVLTVRFLTLFHDHWCVCCLKASCHSALEAGLEWASGTVRQDCSVQRARGSWLAGSSSSMLDVAHFQGSHAEAFMGPCTAHCWVPPNSTLSEPKAPIYSSIKFHCALLAQ